MPQRLIGDALDEHAEHAAQHHGHDQRQKEIQMKDRRRVKCRKGTQHVNVSMRKIDQLDDAVHHRIPQCDQRIDASQRKPVYQLL